MSIYNIINHNPKYLLRIWLLDITLFIICTIFAVRFNSSNFNFLPSYFLYLYWLLLLAVVMNGIWAFFAYVYKIRHSTPTDETIQKHKKLIKVWSNSMVVFTISLFALFIGQDVITRNDEFATLLMPYSYWILQFSGILVIFSFVLGCLSYASVYLMSTHNKEDKLSNGKLPTISNLISTIKVPLEDVLFIPRKKTNHIQTVAIVIFVITAMVLGLYFYPIDDGYSPDNSSVDVQQTNGKVVDISPYLQITNLTSTSDGAKFVVKGTVQNTNISHAKNVVLRVDFYTSQNESLPFDTRFITVEYVAGKGAYSFEELLSINYDKKYWFNVNIESAEQL